MQLGLVVSHEGQQSEGETCLVMHVDYTVYNDERVNKGSKDLNVVQAKNRYLGSIKKHKSM